MRLSTPQAKIEHAVVARKVVDLAGLPVDTALANLEAVSEEQRNFAGDIRLYAIYQIWAEEVECEYQTPEFARALIAACNKHKDAAFWLNHKSATASFADVLGDDIDF